MTARLLSPPRCAQHAWIVTDTGGCSACVICCTAYFSAFWRCCPRVVPGLPPTDGAAVGSVHGAISQFCVGSLGFVVALLKSMPIVATCGVAKVSAVSVAVVAALAVLMTAMYQRPATSGTWLDGSTITDSADELLK